MRVAGRKEVVGKPFLYATTRDFLMHFGLRHLDELPPLEQFEEMWAGDSEADADAPPDLEEQAGLEQAEIEQRDEAAADAAENEEDLRQSLEAEAAELPVDAEEPSVELESDDGDTEADADDPGDSDEEESHEEVADDGGSDDEPEEEHGHGG